MKAEQEEMERRRQRLLDRQLDAYRQAIHDKVRGQWRRPVGAPPGLQCEVLVTQIPGGEIVDVRITAPSGNAAFDDSVEKAVLKASPLPRPRDPSLFQRKLKFIFDPGG